MKLFRFSAYGDILPKVVSILSVMYLCSIFCNAQVPDNYGREVSLAVDNFARHERRLLSSSDVFDVSIYPERNLVVISSQADDDHHNNYGAIVTPIDTTINYVASWKDDGMVWTWIKHPSDTILTVTWVEGARNYTVSYSPKDVLIDFSCLPNRMIESKGRWFFWQDDTVGESRDVIDTLIGLNRVDFFVKGLVGGGVINDGEEVVCYDLNALRKGRIKKYHDYGLYGKGFRGWFRHCWYSQSRIKKKKDAIE